MKNQAFALAEVYVEFRLASKGMPSFTALKMQARSYRNSLKATSRMIYCQAKRMVLGFSVEHFVSSSY